MAPPFKDILGLRQGNGLPIEAEWDRDSLTHKTRECRTKLPGLRQICPGKILPQCKFLSKETIELSLKRHAG